VRNKKEEGTYDLPMATVESSEVQRWERRRRIGGTEERVGSEGKSGCRRRAVRCSRGAASQVRKPLWRGVLSGPQSIAVWRGCSGRGAALQHLQGGDEVMSCRGYPRGRGLAGWSAMTTNGTRCEED
jgi:hypothetical protein